MTAPEPWAGRWGVPCVILALAVAAHVVGSPAGEPWKNNDETRHVMTGVFVRDALYDLPASARDPRGYAERYYRHYPALGVLVWPPLFYAVEGVVMAGLGPTYFAARLTLTAFAISAFFSARTLFRRTVGPTWANVALAVVVAGPLVVEYSRFVLLEVPTLALVLASVNRFEAYLTGGRRRDALLACLWAAAAALTRFDGVVLLPYFCIRLTAEHKLAWLLRWPVLAGMALALCLTLPYYLFTWAQYRPGLTAAATVGTADHSTGWLALDNFWLYPAYTFGQVGRFVTLAAVVGLTQVWRQWRGATGPLVALMAATYVTFVPLAEPEPRHAIYWVPALTGLAALGIKWVAERRGHRVAAVAAFLVVATVGGQSFSESGWYVRGYADAAKYVVSHRQTDRPVMFDGVLTGGFIYQVRLLDPSRTLRVVRGDKLLYAVMSDPHGGYVDLAATEDAVRERLHAADPEFIIVESPQMFDLVMPAADRLRVVLITDPHCYRFEGYVKFASNHYMFQGSRLEVYRKLDRNPTPDDRAAIPVLGLGRGVGD